MTDYNTLTNAELFEGLANKDKGVIKFVYDKYSPCIYSIILINVKSTSEADDVLFDTFISLYKSEDLHLPQAKSVFIYLRNLTFSTIKKRKVFSINQSPSPLHIDITKLFKPGIQR